MRRELVQREQNGEVLWIRAALWRDRGGLQTPVNRRRRSTGPFSARPRVPLPGLQIFSLSLRASNSLQIAKFAAHHLETRWLPLRLALVNNGPDLYSYSA